MSPQSRSDPAPTTPGDDAGLDAESLQEIDRWVAELRSEDAIRSRTRTTWLRRQAQEASTFPGVLTDLAQIGRPVLLHLRSGRRHRGRLRLVGVDFCALRSVQGTDLLIGYAAIAGVRVQPGDSEVVGDRPVRPRATLHDALSALDRSGRRAMVVAGVDGESLAGCLEAVGRDVATLRLDGTGGLAYVRLASVAEVSVEESG